jgi:hypothetical protein
MNTKLRAARQIALVWEHMPSRDEFLAICAHLFFPTTPHPTYHRSGPWPRTPASCLCQAATSPARWSNDAQHTLQVANCSDANSNYDVQYKGTTFQLNVFSLAEASAQRHMPIKIPMDTSKFIVSPMPGAVMNIGVKVGDKGTYVYVCVCDMHT